MSRTHEYRVRAEWNGNRGVGTPAYRDYGREVTLRVDGKPDLLASADVPFLGDPRRWNPEDLLLSALVECHLLSYLYACVRVGVSVVGYEDDALARMEESGTSGAFVEVVLRPRVVVADAAMIEPAIRAHDDAHALCFIASSVAFPVRHEPTVVAAADVTDARAAGPA